MGMKKIAFILFAIFILLSCDKSVKQNTEAPGDISLVQEKDSPLLFMDVEGKIRTDIETNKRILYGTISNTAMQTKFKDVELTIKYYSQTNDLIETSDIIVYKFFEPDTRTKFELSVNPPDSMLTCEVEVKNAKATN